MMEVSDTKRRGQLVPFACICSMVFNSMLSISGVLANWLLLSSTDFHPGSTMSAY
jgi:hypothetical protein